MPKNISLLSRMEIHLWNGGMASSHGISACVFASQKALLPSDISAWTPQRSKNTLRAWRQLLTQTAYTSSQNVSGTWTRLGSSWITDQLICAEKGTKYLHSRTSGNRETITIIAAINAAGGSLPPHIIVKGKTKRSWPVSRQKMPQKNQHGARQTAGGQSRADSRPLAMAARGYNFFLLLINHHEVTQLSQCQGCSIMTSFGAILSQQDGGCAYTHTHPFNGPLSGTTRMSQYQKGKTSLDFTEARDTEWQWHPLGHMQVCTSLQTDNHASTPPLSFLQAGCPSCHRTNSIQSTEGMDGGCASKTKTFFFENPNVEICLFKKAQQRILNFNTDGGCASVLKFAAVPSWTN